MKGGKPNKELIKPNRIKYIDLEPPPAIDIAATEQLEEPQAMETEDDQGQTAEVTVREGIPGLDKVKTLAKYLVDRQDDPWLSMTQVARIAEYYDQLNDYDKHHLRYPARHKEHPTGQFAQRKKAFHGITSVERAFRNSATTAANSPAISRLVEHMILMLAEIYKCKPSKNKQSAD